MMDTCLRGIVALAFAVSLATWARPAYALFIGDPVPDSRRGEWEGGVAISGPGTYFTGFANYGLSDTKALRGEVSVGSWSGFSSTEGGATFRAAVSQFRIGGKDARWAFLGGVHAGSIDTFRYTYFVVGPGISVAITNPFAAYGGLAFLAASATGKKRDIWLENSLLLYGGGSYAVDRRIKVGGEIHVFSGSGFALWAKYKF